VFVEREKGGGGGGGGGNEASFSVQENFLAM